MDIPRSRYYYKPRKNETKLKEDADIRDRIKELALRFPRYGYRPMTNQLKREGFQINRKQVLRIMREPDLLCKNKRRFAWTTDSNHPYPVYPNLYGNKAITLVNSVWVADITYIRLLAYFVFLAVSLDACSHKVAGWALSRRINAELTCAAKAAIARRKPSPGCIHHSDRGVQYASHQYVQILKKQGFLISMSRKGNPYDNAQAESFFKTLKYEEVHLWEYRSLAEVQEIGVTPIFSTARMLLG